MKEFEFPNIEGSIKDYLKGTVRKYYYCLQGFLKLSIAKEYLLYHPLIISKVCLKLIIQKHHNSSLNCQCLCWLNDYVKCRKCYNYSPIYSLSINSSIISLLNFESIDDKKNLTYFDTKL